MKDKLILLFLLIPIVLFANAGSIIIPQELPIFWIASFIIIFIEIILILIFKTKFSLIKTSLFVFLANITSTILGIPLFIIYLKIWERFQYGTNLFFNIILFVVIFIIPTILIEFLFYNRILAAKSGTKRFIQTTIIHIFSYACLILTIYVGRLF